MIDTFLKIVEIFNKKKVKYCIIGGLALNLYGILRRTEDIDIFLCPEKENIRLALSCLKEVFRDEELNKLKQEDFINYAVIRYGTPEGFYIDLVTKIGDTISWDEVKENIEWKKLEDIEIPVPDLELLIKMKEGASSFRERDKVDLIYLKKLKEKLNKSLKNDKKI